MTTIQLVRASVKGIVYLIEPTSGKVYTYAPEAPLYVGQLELCDDKLTTSKSDGCLAGCRVRYRSDLKDAITTYASR